MRAVDPSITLLASGSMPDEMTVEGQPRTLGIADPQVHFGDARTGLDGRTSGAQLWQFRRPHRALVRRVGKRFDYDHAKSLPMDSPWRGGM